MCETCKRITGYTMNDLEYISSGIIANCNECCKIYTGSDSEYDMQEFKIDVDQGNVYDEGSFSHYPCNDCNTTLGGDSYIAHGIDCNGELIHFSICYDCLMELNGYTWNCEFKYWEG